MAIVNATAGVDTFDGLGTGTTAGDDTIIYTQGNQVDNAPPTVDSINGGAGFDTIQIGTAGNGITIDLGKAPLVAPFVPAIFLNIEALAFANTAGTSTARILAEQFGAGLISMSLAVTGGLGSNQVIDITFLDAAAIGGNFDGSAWTFSNWTSGADVISIRGSAEADVITGTIMADIIDGNTGNDIFNLANGYFAVGESITGGTNAAGLEDDALVLTNATSVDFSTGIVTQIERLTGSAGSDSVTMTFAQWGGFATGIDLGAGTNTLNVVAGTGGITGGGAIGLPASIANVTTGNLVGTAGNDAITISGAQIDAIIVGSGTIDLGVGSDTINLTSTSADLNALGAVDASISNLETISAAGAAAGAVIFLGGQSEAFSVVGGNGTDTITTGGGADIITGGGGADTIRAGLGDDIINLPSGNFVAGESIDGGGGNDTIALINNVTVDLSTGTIANVENLVGSAASDTVSVSGTQWTHFVSIDLAGGNNILNVVANGDIAAGPTPTLANVVTGNLRGTAGNDSITLTGAELDAIIVGGGTIDLGLGSDTINLTSTSADLNLLGTSNNALAGVETISAASAVVDVTINVSAQSEAFTVTGGGGGDALTGGSGADSISGGSGNDTLAGGAGADSLNGGTGNDTLIGGSAGDVLTGGGGGDNFAFAAGDSALTLSGNLTAGNVSGYDLIADFTSGSGIGISDAISYSGAVIASNSTSTDGANSVLQLHTSTVVAAHSIANGIISFDDAAPFAGTVALTSIADVAAATDYLQRNSLGALGTTVAFTATIAGAAHTYVYIEGGANGTDELIDLVNVSAVTISATAGQINVHVPPTVVGDTLAAIEDTPITFAAAELLANDTNAFSIASVSNGAGGSASLNLDGTVTFTPNQNFSGVAAFTYVATEGSLNSAPAPVTVNVSQVNDVPVATPVTLASIAEDSGIRLITAAQLLSGVSDVDNSAAQLSIAALSIATGSGSLVATGIGAWSYTPALNDDSSVTFNYTASDGALTASSTASLDITPVNDAPVVSGLVSLATVDDNQVATGNLLFSASDADSGDVLSIVAAGPGAISASLTSASGISAASLATAAGFADVAAFNTELTAYVRGVGVVNAATGALSLDANGFAGLNALDVGQSAAITLSYTVTDLAGATASASALLTVNGALESGTPSTALADNLTGTDFGDRISALGGDDIINAGGGNDTVFGGDGNDSIDGGTGDDVAFGDAGNDNIIGGAGNDILIGGAGNDLLDGGAGLNTLQGGSGDDIYIVSNRIDSTFELADDGVDEVRTNFTIYGLQSNVENLAFTDGGAHGAGVGNTLDNVLTGNAGVDDLFGREGNDTLRGGSGLANTLLGQEGNDTYIVEAQGDTVIEFAGQGIDTVQTALSSFVLRDNVENLIYTGSGIFTGIGSIDDNGMTGGAGADFLSGLNGNDILTSGSGADLLLGGNGADQFRYNSDETGLDRILDFTSGSDKIALSGAGFVHTATADFVSDASPVAVSTNSTFLYNSQNGILSFDADGTGAGAAIQIAQLNAGLTLAASDFIFF
jgi:Ca2+-binding RTX toxin-like protein